MPPEHWGQMRKTKLGQELITGLKEAVAHAQGRKKLRATIVEVPGPAVHWGKTQIVRLRKERFQVSQPVFAAYLSVKPATIRAWEQGRKTPSGAASRLLEVASLDPKVFERLAHAK